MLEDDLANDEGGWYMAVYRVVFMLSNGVTANTDSNTPAPRPATTVRGAESLPSASWSNALIWSNTTNPDDSHVSRYIKRYCSQCVKVLTDTCFDRVPNDESRAPSIPC